MNSRFLTMKEAASEAAHKLITANELDIVVSTTRQINRIRERNILKMKALLTEVESKLL